MNQKKQLLSVPRLAIGSLAQCLRLGDLSHGEGLKCSDKKKLPIQIDPCISPWFVGVISIFLGVFNLNFLDSPHRTSATSAQIVVHEDHNLHSLAASWGTAPQDWSISLLLTEAVFEMCLLCLKMCLMCLYIYRNSILPESRAVVEPPLRLKGCRTAPETDTRPSRETFPWTNATVPQMGRFLQVLARPDIKQSMFFQRFTCQRQPKFKAKTLRSKVGKKRCW